MHILLWISANKETLPSFVVLHSRTRPVAMLKLSTCTKPLFTWRSQKVIKCGFYFGGFFRLNRVIRLNPILALVAIWVGSLISFFKRFWAKKCGLLDSCSRNALFTSLNVCGGNRVLEWSRSFSSSQQYSQHSEHTDPVIWSACTCVCLGNALRRYVAWVEQNCCGIWKLFMIVLGDIPTSVLLSCQVAFTCVSSGGWYPSYFEKDVCGGSF